MDSKEMIDRYVNEVGQHLPRKTRADIELELRSLLHDALDEQSDGKPSPKIAAEMLREFGHPKEIAAQYRPDEVLIGSQLFPIYRLVIMVTVAIIGGGHLLSLGVGFLSDGISDFVNPVIDHFFAFGRSAFLNAGIVTLIFAVVERIWGDSLNIPAEQPQSWDPFQLPPVKDPDRINRLELFAGVFFGLIFISWLNFFPDWFGAIDFNGGDEGVFALFAPEFLQYIPWLTTSWLLDILLKTAVLIQGRWSRITRWLELGTEAFSIYVLYQIYLSEVISTIPIFTTLAKWGVVAIMIIVGLDMMAKLYRLLFGRPFTPQSFFKSKLA